jgi:hypothetical protein
MDQSSSAPSNNKPMLKFTGLWKGKTKSGNTCLTGPVNQFLRLVVLQNTRKQKDNDPDYVAFFSAQEPRPAAENQNPKEDL